MSSTQEAKVTIKDFQVDFANDWCAGCGDFGMLSALQRALVDLRRQPHEVAVFGGIGCSGKAVYYLPTYGIHTLHGRVLPFATGAKLANPELTVVAVGGDGDGLGIGSGHFVNAGRRNVDMTYILLNNEVYGLTKGQAAPTLPQGLQTKAMHRPTAQSGLNGLMLALTSGFTWIARAYAFDVKQTIELMEQAIRHPGLAYLDVLQPCPTYNDLHTKDWFAAEGISDGHSRTYRLEEDEEYDPVIDESDDEQSVMEKMAAFYKVAHQWGDHIPTGVFLENRTQTTFGQRLDQQLSTYCTAPPAQRTIADDEGRPNVDLKPFFDEVRVRVEEEDEEGTA